MNIRFALGLMLICFVSTSSLMAQQVMAAGALKVSVCLKSSEPCAVSSKVGALLTQASELPKTNSPEFVPPKEGFPENRSAYKPAFNPQGQKTFVLPHPALPMISDK